MRTEDRELVHEFKRLIHVLSMGKRTAIRYGETNLYRAEAHILEIIGDTKAITATDIARNLGITKGAISQVITKLFKKGLLRKENNINNAKSQGLHLTFNGQKVLAAHEERERYLLRKIDARLKGLRPEDVKDFSEIVKHITDFIAD